MTLWVRSFGAYRAEVSSNWRNQDYLVRNLVKSLKGETFRGHSDYTLGGKPQKIDATDSSAAYLLWSNWAVQQIRALGLGQVTIVPVPSSGQTEFVQDTTPVRMANAVVSLDPKSAKVGNYLRHSTKQLKAHSEGGSRDPGRIEKSLVCSVPKGVLSVVLVDDVMTTGGHLMAAARALRDKGLNVEHVLIAGRTVWEAVPNPYKVTPEDIEAIPDFDDLSGLGA